MNKKANQLVVRYLKGSVTGIPATVHLNGTEVNVVTRIETTMIFGKLREVRLSFLADDVEFITQLDDDKENE